MKCFNPSLAFLAFFAGAVATGWLATRFPDAAMPRGAGAESALAVAFGDARKVISNGMLSKMDVYFHGGIDISDRGHDQGETCDHCSCGHDHCGHDHDDNHVLKPAAEAEKGHERCDHEHGKCEHEHCDHEHGKCEHEHCDHEHGKCENEHEHEAEELARAEAKAAKPKGIVKFLDDPFEWVNSRIRAPKVDRHLDNEKAVELVPFVWASVKADPHNLEGWEVGCFILAGEMQREDLAMKLLKEGLELNPGSATIYEMMAKLTYQRGKGDKVKAKELYEKSRTVYLEAFSRLKAGEHIDEHDERGYLYSLGVLALYAYENKDVEELKRLREDALKPGNENFASVGIAEKIKELSKEK